MSAYKDIFSAFQLQLPRDVAYGLLLHSLAHKQISRANVATAMQYRLYSRLYLNLSLTCSFHDYGTLPYCWHSGEFIPGME